MKGRRLLGGERPKSVLCRPGMPWQRRRRTRPPNRYYVRGGAGDLAGRQVHSWAALGAMTGAK
jgi:hypothetical protein